MRSLSNYVVVCMNRSSRKVNGWVLCSAGITRITACQPTSRRSTCSGPRLRTAGSSRFGDEASAAASTGRGWIGSRNSGFLVPALFILGRSSALLSEPEIRAQCGSSARWNLCGGAVDTVTCQSSLPRPPLTIRQELLRPWRFEPLWFPGSAHRGPMEKHAPISPRASSRLSDVR